MYLLYLSSSDGRALGGTYRTVVRAELISESQSAVRYYRYKNCGQDQAKLKSAIRFLEDYVIPLQKEEDIDLTIYLDGHELAFDYTAANERNFADTDFPEDWRRLINVLDKLKWLVFIKEKGVLSVSMRDELQQYIVSVKNQCTDMT